MFLEGFAVYHFFFFLNEFGLMRNQTFALGGYSAKFSPF